jgi:hypothetical protein
MVRYRTASAGEPRWAKVESWADAEHSVVRDTGQELTPGIRLSPPISVETRQIVDWGVWVEGEGIVEGARTEGLGHHLS